VGAGACDVTGNVVLLVAVRRALTVVVAPIGALAPAFTVLCAALFLRERLAVVQWTGMALGVAGVALIATG
jgi:drug/metabolite transporter (DMT)-like permease